MTRIALLLCLFLGGCVAAVDRTPGTTQQVSVTLPPGESIALHKMLAREAAAERPARGVCLVFVYAEPKAVIPHLMLPTPVNEGACITDGGRCSLADVMKLMGASRPRHTIIYRLVPAPKTA